jgi:hypothetical protein
VRHIARCGSINIRLLAELFLVFELGTVTLPSIRNVESLDRSISIEAPTRNCVKVRGCAVPALPIVSAICYKPFFAVTTIIVSVQGGESVYPPRLRAQTMCFDGWFIMRDELSPKSAHLRRTQAD